MSQNNPQEMMFDCKKRALARLRLAEYRFPFVKVVDSVSVPDECVGESEWKTTTRTSYPIGVFTATRQAFQNHIRAAWQETLHEGINLSDASGVQVFLERPKLAHVLGQYSFVHVQAHKPSQSRARPRDSDLDCPLTRCARMNGDVVVGEALLRCVVEAEIWGCRPRNAAGDTCLHICARFKRREFAQLVVKYLGHRDFWKENDREKSALDLGIMRFMTNELMVGPCVREKKLMSMHKISCSGALWRCVEKHQCRFCAQRMSKDRRQQLNDWAFENKHRYTEHQFEDLITAVTLRCPR